MVIVSPGPLALPRSAAIEHHVADHCLLEGIDMGKVYDHTGIWIGTVHADGRVYDHCGVWIGSVAGDGDVYDHTCVRIGKVPTPA